MGNVISTLPDVPELRLWECVDERDGWLCRHGRSRLVLVDDQLPDRTRLFDVSNDAPYPLAAGEKLLRDRLNTDIQYFPMPDDWRETDFAVAGSFTEDWFEEGLRKVLEDPRPIAAFCLDMLFGEKESGIENASGLRFLKIIRKHLPKIPVIILTTLHDDPVVIEHLKTVGAPFEDFLPKTDPDNPELSLMERIADKLIWWGLISDPSISAFSEPMRFVARQMRRIVLSKATIHYEEKDVGRLPKPVVLLGEYGSGKNFLANHLVKMSERGGHRPLNCTFTEATEESVVATLFGALMFQGASECHYTDVRTGAVVRTGGPSRRAGNGHHVIGLGTIGILQGADMGFLPQGDPPKPLKGTVILDELGAASPSMQTRLLGVLNRGQFKPQFGSVDIPSERRLDLWYLVLSTPAAYNKMRRDLQSRLGRGDFIRIPELADREEDLPALALEMWNEAPDRPSPRLHDPRDLFTEEAMDMLLDLGRHSHQGPRFEVRDLNALLNQLPETTARTPFGAGDVGSALELLRAIRPAEEPDRRRWTVPDKRSTEASEPEQPPSAAPEPVLSPRLVVEYLSDPERVPFAGEPPPGAFEEIMGCASNLVLSYLDWAIGQVEPPSVQSGFPIVALSRFLTGVTEQQNANKIRTNLARLLLIHPNHSCRAIHGSERLLRFAQDVSKRNSAVAELLDGLEERK